MTHPGSTAAEPHLSSGQILSERYEILRLLAVGGMSEIYVARHLAVGRQVAIKVLKPMWAADPETRARFVSEARVAGMLGHPNIVECSDMGVTEENIPYLVLELLRGRDLHTVLDAERKVPVARAVAVAMQIASGLEMAHFNGIVHRDLKPENIFLIERPDRAEFVKILDFGVSKLNHSERGETVDGRLLGTPDYMAPEQIRKASQVDARADVWALGMILYEMLAGAAPFAHLPFPHNVAAIERDSIRPIGEVVEGLPEGLSAVVSRMLAREVADRYASMLDVFMALAPFAGSLAPAKISVHQIEVPPVRSTLLSHPSTKPITSSAPAPLPARSSSSSSRLLTAAGLGGLVLLFGGGWWWQGRAATVGVPAASSSALVAPASASAPVSSDVDLSVQAPDAAQVIFRGQKMGLPFKGKVPRGLSPEMLEVSAPGRVTLRHWIRVDRPLALYVEPPPGSGSRDASEEETTRALTGVAAAPLLPLLDSAQIQKVVREHREDIQKCLDALPEQNEVAGALSIEGEVSAQGAVTRLEMNNTTGQPSLEPCIARALRGWRFGALEQPRRIVYTFKFR